ncbi:MAG: hypothetical protein A2Y10_08560 [Planctomycetes bacterium GWF2_41_51]|nr:MAG: hypothetical protein A2Y10_08560 [Planctomycetes bacterium GWF2_41_51]HBG28585.1 hypothetical protein [Phycisphaerales bacterium]
MAAKVSNFGQSLYKVKTLFFDSPAVLASVDSATRKVLNRIGGMIRLTARRSIKKAPSHTAVSKPGKPPLSHTGLLRNYIYYSFDPLSRSVLVGPVALNAKGKNVPRILEYSGSAKIKGKNVHIAARPFMASALRVNQPKMAALWKNSVRK